MNKLTDRLHQYIEDPTNALNNFLLGNKYEDTGHTAAAAGLYVRTAEFGTNNLMIYEALLRLALCLERQGSRTFTVRGVLLRAISIYPDRPEAIFLLARSYEMGKDWQEAYTWATIGEKLTACLPTLLTNVEYAGPWLFVFERAVAAWWIGLYDESLFLFRQLAKRTDLTEIHRSIIENNLATLSDSNKEPILYDASQYERLRIKFKGASEIKRNYSQVFQDMFVLTMLDGKRNGKYLEIGCGDPFYGNNTALLEEQFGWDGISIDLNTDKFSKERKGTIITGDATKVDYQSILEGDYDYLQIDTDPAEVSLKVLLAIPFESHKFAVITFEHDNYADEKSGIRERSRQYLRSHGYILVVPDIAPDKFNSYEDWWVHRELVDEKIIEKMMDYSASVKRGDDYMLT
jgi:tetratricopeptide (TPR) repeat protein